MRGLYPRSDMYPLSQPLTAWSVLPMPV
jgi:hypothetical protein